MFSVIRGAIFAIATGVALISLASQFPVMRAASEEARIFNADNADLFGEDPYLSTELALRKIVAIAGDEHVVISIDGVDQQLRSGDLLLSPCLSLSRILSGAVLLNHCGSYTFLGLQESAASSAVMNLRVASVRAGNDAGRKLHVVDLRDDVDVQGMLSDYRQRLYDRPLSLLGAINVDVVNGEYGREYYISPGRDKLVFPTLELEPGDRVRGLNGVDLSGGQSLTEIYERLDDISYMAITLERNSEDWVVVVNFEAIDLGVK